jgi:hypothetical protein
MSSNSSIVVVDIDIEKYNSIEREREKIMSDKNFIAWLNEYKIGSRVEVKDYRARELNQQYADNYPKWVQRMFN